jgi:hypothetical protein
MMHPPIFFLLHPLYKKCGENRITHTLRTRVQPKTYLLDLVNLAAGGSKTNNFQGAFTQFQTTAAAGGPAPETDSATRPGGGQAR